MVFNRWKRKVGDYGIGRKEQLKSFIDHYVQIWTIVDLLLKNSQNMWFLIDWKLSTFDWEKDCRQLAFYGLYVQKVYSNSKSLKLINFYLNSGYEHSFLWDEQIKQLSEVYFEKSVRYVQVFHQKLNEKHPFRCLQTATKKQICWQCRYKKICLTRKCITHKLDNIKNETHYKREEDWPSNWMN